MAHADNEQQWLQGICQNIIDQGKYKMAWIGFVQIKGSKNISPVASAGFEEGYLASIKVTWGDDEYAQGPAGCAVRENKVSVCQDVEVDASFEPWRKDAIQRGYQSLCAAPVAVDNEMQAVLVVYAHTKHAFSDTDFSFLQELASDISFGIRAIRMGEEHKKALEGLSAEKQKFKSIVESIDAGIVLLNADLKITWANDIYQQWFGKMETIFGKHCCEVLSLENPVNQCVATAVTFSRHLEKMTMQLTLQSKEKKCFDLVAAPLFDANGELVQIVETIMDVTEQIMLQKKRQQAEDSLNEAQYIAHVGSWELEIQSNKLLWSKEMFHLFEIDSKKCGASYAVFLDAIHPDDRVRVDEAYSDSLKNKQPYEIVHRLLMKDGRIKYVHECCETNFNDKGEPVRSFGTIQDITESIQVEQKLINSEEHYRQLIESTTAIPWEFNPQTGCFIYVGPQVEKVLGYLVEEWYQEDFWSQHIHPDDRKYAIDLCRESTARGEDHTFECRMIAQDGRSIWIHYDAKVIKENSKIVRLQGFMFNVTERRHTEEIMRHSQKMDAVGKLTGGIAHDFNNQLGIVRGYLDFLEEFTRGQDKPHRWVDLANKATNRCIDLSRNLLDFSRRQQMNVQQLTINSVLEKMYDIIAHSITPRIEIKYNLENDIWPIAVNPGELEDSILNLVINAQDAMPDGGQLTISTINQKVEQDSNVQLDGLSPGDYVWLSIKDTGKGMNENIKERIFEPFYTTKEDGDSSGLGLSMVYSFVKRSSGLIMVNSEPEKGSDFHIYLPRFIDASDSQIKTNNQVDKKQSEIENIGQGETVLVVEDEPQLRELAEYFLHMLGYNTLLSANADEAILILKTDVNIDLLFSDIIMPGKMTGYNLVEYAATIRPQIKVLLTSGFTGGESAHNDYQGVLLQKPYSKQELADAVNRALDVSKHDKTKHTLDKETTHIKWADELTVKNKEMDDDHKNILALLNDYQQVVVEEAGNDVIDRKFQLLVEFSGYHFSREEVLMEACGYPHHVKHHQIHVMLLRTITDMIKVFREAPDVFDHRSTISFLEYWFKAHVLDMDVEYASYLRGYEDDVDRALEKLTPAESNNISQPLRYSLIVVDDQKSMGEFVCDIAETAGFNAMHYIRASEFIENHEKKSAVIVLDLLMPDIDGIEMIRLLAGMQSEAALILISGVDKTVLHSAQELAIEHGLNLAGTLQKPFHVFELKKILSGISERLKETKPVSTIKTDKVLINEDDLRRAVNNREFIAYYQPQISIQDRTVDGFEVLMRWMHPERGLILPYQFIGLAEVTGLIDEMTWLLVDQVARDCEEKHLKQTISVNMTAGIFKQLDLPDRLNTICKRYGHRDNSQLTLEVTESALMEELTKSLDSLTRLRMKGFKLSIDDFGTGYSSMIQLYRAPFTELKVDQSFVMRMEDDDEARAIVESTIQLGQNLNMKVVAEGVETESILRKLEQMNCDIAQGYYIARPMPIEDVLPWIEEWQSKNKK